MRDANHGSPEKLLLTCSTGGHLSELIRLEHRLGIHPDSLWVTFDTPQSRELLRGRRVHHLPYVGPRDLRGTLAAMRILRRLVRRERFDRAVSTGAAVATAALPIARLAGIPSTYIESASRLRGPSTTGRILERVPGIELLTQHAAWASGRWRPTGSILGDFHSKALPMSRPTDRLFVTLGTIRGYRFDSLVDALLASGHANERTVWQLGSTRRTDLPGRVHDYLSPAEFAREARQADVVVSHAGVGTLLELLGMGIFPVLAARRAVRNEHVDDHQTEIADLVNASRIGLAVEGPEVTAAVITRAARWGVVDIMRVNALNAA